MSTLLTPSSRPILCRIRQSNIYEQNIGYLYESGIEPYGLTAKLHHIEMSRPYCAHLTIEKRSDMQCLGSGPSIWSSQSYT